MALFRQTTSSALTVFCPAVDEAVGQFYILQLDRHLLITNLQKTILKNHAINFGKLFNQKSMIN